MPYDVPDQTGWTSGHGPGWAAYKVGADVRRHEAWGLGSYCYFAIDHRNTHVVAARAFEAPETPGVRLHSLVTVSLGGNGTIRHIVNDSGAPTEATGAAAMTLRSWP